MKKTIFIAWIRYHRRAELLAQHLGAEMHFVQYGQPGQFLQAPIRYVMQALKTWQILSREKPTVVLVQNPPIFLALLVFIYSRLYGARYVIDSHTGAFQVKRWKWSVGLHRMLSRGALMTIVHNKSQEKIVERWGCRYCVVGFTPGDYPVGEPFPLNGQFNLAMTCSFVDGDEPIEEVLEAARKLPEVNFYLTGNNNLLPSSVLSKKPDNCHFVGFLSYNQYVGLLRSVDAVMDLTKWNHTVLMGGFEAVSLGKPFITSDWPILKEYFSPGAVHVSNTVEGICAGVRRTQLEYGTLQRDILILQNKLDNEWKQKLQMLRELIDK